MAMKEKEKSEKQIQTRIGQISLINFWRLMRTRNNKILVVSVITSGVFTISLQYEKGYMFTISNNN